MELFLSALVLGVALAVDATAIAMTAGLSAQHKGPLAHGIELCLLFGLFQALMTWLGKTVMGPFEFLLPYAPMLSGVTFIGLAIWSLKGVLGEDDKQIHMPESRWHKLVLALATSIDALVAGFGLVGHREANWVVIIVGVTTFLLSMIGFLAAGKVKMPSEKRTGLVASGLFLFLGIKSFF